MNNAQAEEEFQEFYLDKFMSELGICLSNHLHFARAHVGMGLCSHRRLSAKQKHV